MFSKKHTLPVVLVFLFIASLAFISATVTGSNSVPFLGRGNGHDLTVVPEADGIHISADVEGQATQLGHFIERLDYVLAYDFVHFSGTGLFTAANGDELHVQFSGIIPGFSSGNFPTPYSSRFVVTGGTGRFQNASGSGIITGQDFGSGLFSASWIGTLDR